MFTSQTELLPDEGILIYLNPTDAYVTMKFNHSSLIQNPPDLSNCQILFAAYLEDQENALVITDGVNSRVLDKSIPKGHRSMSITRSNVVFEAVWDTTTGEARQLRNALDLLDLHQLDKKI